MSDHERVAAQDGWMRYGWLMGAIWLVFLVYPGLALVGSDATLLARALGWLGLLAFATAYLTGFIRGMRDQLGHTSPATLALFWSAIACALLTAPAIGWSALSFTPFLMSYSSYLLSRRWHWAVNVIGPALVVSYVAVSGANAGSQPWGLLWIVLMIALVNSINSWLIRRSARADALRFELATSEERESVARDVHDLLGHSLTVVKLKAELASRLIEQDPAAARAELEQIVRLTSEALAGVRGTVTGLRADGLAEQLAATSDALSSAGIALEVHGTPAALSPAQSIPAAWVLREATTNVLRHSRATRVRVELAPGTLLVEDDGVGMDEVSATARATTSWGTEGSEDGGRQVGPGSPDPSGHPGAAAAVPAAGNGIRGMGERASASGGDLRILAAPQRGTRVSLTW